MDLFVTRHSSAVVLCSRAVFQMLFHTDRTFTVLVFQLLLTHSCRGQPQVIGSSQPIVAMLGDDTILSCHLEPAESAVAMTLEWARRDVDPSFVYLWRSGEELVIKNHKSFEGRMSMFVNELKFGNISLKLSKVKLTDQGRYRCFIPGLERDAYVQLVVGAASSAAVSLAGINKTTNGVMLQCESEGWYPEPDLLWLDAEGNLLSAGPPETLRGPDDLYTVSSRVTVDKRDNTTFTCRVQQKDTNQTRETHIHVPDEFFQLQSAAASITGLAVGLAVCIVFILILLLVVWMGWRQNKTKRRHSAGTDEEEKKNKSKTNRPDDQITVETERLMTSGIQMEESEGNVQKEKNFIQKLTSNKKKEELKKELKEANEELEKTNKELKEANEELEKTKSQLKMKDEEISQLNRELEKKLREEETKMEQAEPEVENQMKDLNIKPEDDGSQQDDSSSTTGPGIVIEVNQRRKHIRLINESHENQQLEGWKLEMEVNGKTSIYTFENSIELKSGKPVNIFGPSSRLHSTGLQWKDLIWNPEDTLKFTLVNDTGHTRHQLNYTKIKKK